MTEEDNKYAEESTREREREGEGDRFIEVQEYIYLEAIELNAPQTRQGERSNELVVEINPEFDTVVD